MHVRITQRVSGGPGQAPALAPNTNALREQNRPRDAAPPPAAPRRLQAELGELSREHLLDAGQRGGVGMRGGRPARVRVVRRSDEHLEAAEDKGGGSGGGGGDGGGVGGKQWRGR